MRNPRTKAPDASTALAAALLFVVHGFFVALASAAHASPSQLDAFGNPLCIGLLGVDSGGQAPGNTPGHTGAPDCCTFGCHAAAGPGKLIVPVAAFAFATRPTIGPALAPAVRLPSGTLRSAVRSRGPPLLA